MTTKCNTDKKQWNKNQIKAFKMARRLLRQGLRLRSLRKKTRTLLFPKKKKRDRREKQLSNFLQEGREVDRTKSLLRKIHKKMMKLLKLRNFFSSRLILTSPLNQMRFS